MTANQLRPRLTREEAKFIAEASRKCCQTEASGTEVERTENQAVEA
jgi:hypothetical protein